MCSLFVPVRTGLSNRTSLLVLDLPNLRDQDWTQNPEQKQKTGSGSDLIEQFLERKKTRFFTISASSAS